jgi:membrane-bound inhibitor of C-type lysozyme
VPQNFLPREEVWLDGFLRLEPRQTQSRPQKVLATYEGWTVVMASVSGAGCRVFAGCHLYRTIGPTAELEHLEESTVRSSDYGLVDCDFV